MIEKNISCECYTKMIDLLSELVVFDGVIGRARRDPVVKEIYFESISTRNPLIGYTKEIKESIAVAVECGLNEMGREKKLTSLVDDVIQSYGDERALGYLWDGILDNLYSVNPCGMAYLPKPKEE